MFNKFSLVKMLLKVGLVGVVTATLFSGCSIKLQSKKQVGSLNLQNPKLEPSDATDLVIAIVSPEIQKKNVASTSNRNFNSTFSKSYEKRLLNSLQSSVSEIIVSKGFKLKGPYNIFDDMTYQDKKKIYLSFIPQVQFTIENKVIKRDIQRLYTHVKGVIQIGGIITISMIEPMTKEVFLKKRINLSDFNIEEPYEYDYQTKYASDGFFDMIGDQMNYPDTINDNTDVALTKAINEFYAKTIEKVNLYLDREEILTFKEDILKLKGLKRF